MRFKFGGEYVVMGPKIMITWCQLVVIIVEEKDRMNGDIFAQFGKKRNKNVINRLIVLRYEKRRINEFKIDNTSWRGLWTMARLKKVGVLFETENVSRFLETEIPKI
jgi:hypothetical protein